MNLHPITTPASSSLASPLFDASFDPIESLTTSFTASALPALETTTVTEVALGYYRNQQYSITAMTTSSGAVAERYAYTAYGQPTILNASGAVLTSSAIGNRYTYTGREWDETLGLHHFRARWMSPLAGRFLGRDPIGYISGWLLYRGLFPLRGIDPLGLFDRENPGDLPGDYYDKDGGCRWERHHWFPVQHQTDIEFKCKKSRFKIDAFTTPLMICWGKYKDCDAHGWLHNDRRPKWNDKVKQILDQSRTCCDFILAMAGEISSAYSELQDEFNPRNCCQRKSGPCYDGLDIVTFDDMNPEFGRGPIQTLNLLAKAVQECRKGVTDPEEIGLPSVSVGIQTTVSPIDILCGLGAVKLLRGSACNVGGSGVAQEPRLIPFPQRPCPSSVPLAPTGTGGFYGW
ncbi:MAG: RHS repeat domain-containing protein [Pirellula sp.]|jgi:RHS repeat-associated protein